MKENEYLEKRYIHARNKCVNCEFSLKYVTRG